MRRLNIPGAGVKTINVGSDPSAAGIGLPTMTKPRTINGYTQGVASLNTLANGDNALILIELNGDPSHSRSGIPALKAAHPEVPILVLADDPAAGEQSLQAGADIPSGNPRDVE